MDYRTIKLTGCGLTAAIWDEPTQSWDLVLRVPEPQLRLFAAALETDDAVRRYHQERTVTPPELECTVDIRLIMPEPMEFDETRPVAADPLKERLRAGGWM